MKTLRLTFYCGCAVAVVLCCLLFGHLKADAPSLILSEVKVRNDTAGFDEFIELYNPTEDPVSLNDYFIGYVNTATPSKDQSFTRFVVGQGLLGAKQSYLLAKNDADPRLPLAQKSPFSSLADSGGTLQITDKSGDLVDELHWTASVVMATGDSMYMPGSTAGKSQAIARVRGTDGSYSIAPARWQLDVPNPQSSTLLPLTPALLDPVDQTDTVITVPSGGDASSPGNLIDEQSPGQSSLVEPIEISELLPNPAAPLTDETDEFVELHNTSSGPIDITDYKLQTGTNFTYTYTIPSHVLQPDAFETFKVSETHLLLSNSGGRGRLLNTQGAVVSQTDVYGTAEAGKSWAYINNVWQWTDEPTPGRVNILSVTPSTTNKTNSSVMTKSPKSTKSATKFSAKPTAKQSTKTNKATTSKPKSGAVTKKNSTKQTNKANPAGPTQNPLLHPLVLAGVGLSTILYGIYEYRYDITDTVRRLRGYGGVRRALGSEAERRGSD